MTEQDVTDRLKAGEDPLELSIEKWNNIIYTLENNEIPNEFASSNCALCHKYLYQSLMLCKGCPVYLQTERVGCNGTPFEKYGLTYLDYNNRDPADNDDIFIRPLLISAKEELEFLKSLRGNKL